MDRPEPWPLHYTCSICKAQFELQRVDVINDATALTPDDGWALIVDDRVVHECGNMDAAGFVAYRRHLREQGPPLPSEP
jgi:hypothetical protein